MIIKVENNVKEVIKENKKRLKSVLTELQLKQTKQYNQMG